MNLSFDIHEIAMTRIDLRLVEPMTTAHGVIDRRPIVLVRIETSLGVGVGECSALADPYYSSQYLNSEEFVLGDFLIPRLLLDSKHTTLAVIMSFFECIKGHHLAKAAVEMALIDVITGSEKISLLSWIKNGQSGQAKVPAGITIGSYRDPEMTLARIEAALTKGYKRIKCKIMPGSDIDILKAIATNFPSAREFELVLDANESYIPDKEGIGLLNYMAGLDDRITAIEQPFGVNDIFRMKDLRQNISCPILLDESAYDRLQIEMIGRLSLADAVVIKPGRLGGILPAISAMQLAKEYGLKCSLGGMYEAGIARSCSLALACLDEVELSSDLGPSENYYKADITKPHLMTNGYIDVPSDIGIGRKLVIDPFDVESPNVASVSKEIKNTQSGLSNLEGNSALSTYRPQYFYPK